MLTCCNRVETNAVYLIPERCITTLELREKPRYYDAFSVRLVMAIGWYPGHMHKATKELTRLMASVQVVIEVLDSRLPAASSNPVLTSLRGEIPCIKVLTKADLAIGTVTRRWQHYFNAQPGMRCLISSSELPLTTEALLPAAEALTAGEQGGSARNKQLVIVGIPNVGKSTLLNLLAQRKLAKTGNEPAITKTQQRIKLAEGWHLIDTPGLLWPKLEDQVAAAKLACTGTIRNTAIATEDVGWMAAELLIAEYRAALVKRYGISESVQTAEQLLETIAATRGAMGSGGSINWHKAAEVLLNDFRSGKLGKFSLETPPV